MRQAGGPGRRPGFYASRRFALLSEASGRGLIDLRGFDSRRKVDWSRLHAVTDFVERDNLTKLWTAKLQLVCALIARGSEGATKEADKIVERLVELQLPWVAVEQKAERRSMAEAWEAAFGGKASDLEMQKRIAATVTALESRQSQQSKRPTR